MSHLNDMILWQHAKCKNFPEVQLNTKRVEEYEDIEGTNFNLTVMSRLIQLTVDLMIMIRSSYEN